MSLILNNLQLYLKEKPLGNKLNLSINSGEIVTLMGPSGCGKSTLLAAIAGHLSADFSLTGELLLNEKNLLNYPAAKRKVGILFQDDLLFPHLNVWQNLAFALDKNSGNKKIIACAMLKEIELFDHKDKYPAELSGGQRARISIIRTLLAKPDLLLLDEPFSKLDAKLRTSFRDFVYKRVILAKIPTLLVSHDIQDVADNGRVINW